MASFVATLGATALFKRGRFSFILEKTFRRHFTKSGVQQASSLHAEIRSYSDLCEAGRIVAPRVPTLPVHFASVRVCLMFVRSHTCLVQLSGLIVAA